MSFKFIIIFLFLCYQVVFALEKSAIRSCEYLQTDFVFFDHQKIFYGSSSDSGSVRELFTRRPALQLCLSYEKIIFETNLNTDHSFWESSFSVGKELNNFLQGGFDISLNKIEKYLFLKDFNTEIVEAYFLFGPYIKFHHLLKSQNDLEIYLKLAYEYNEKKVEKNSLDLFFLEERGLLFSAKFLYKFCLNKNIYLTPNFLLLHSRVFNSSLNSSEKLSLNFKISPISFRFYL
jgi:hypothetical protein